MVSYEIGLRIRIDHVLTPVHLDTHDKRIDIVSQTNEQSATYFERRRSVRRTLDNVWNARLHAGRHA